MGLNEQKYEKILFIGDGLDRIAQCGPAAGGQPLCEGGESALAVLTAFQQHPGHGPALLLFRPEALNLVLLLPYGAALLLNGTVLRYVITTC